MEPAFLGGRDVLDLTWQQTGLYSETPVSVLCFLPSQGSIYLLPQETLSFTSKSSQGKAVKLTIMCASQMRQAETAVLRSTAVAEADRYTLVCE